MSASVARGGSENLSEMFVLVVKVIAMMVGCSGSRLGPWVLQSKGRSQADAVAIVAGLIYPMRSGN